MVTLVDLARRAWGLGLVLVAFLATVFAGLLVRSPLGHDESVYALRGRDILEHGWSTTSGSYWMDYRAPGLSILVASVGRLIGVHATTSRAIVAVLGATVIALTWWIVHRIAGRAAADISAALVAITSGFVLTSSVLLADMPGAAISLAAVAVYLRDLQHGRLTWSLALVPALAFAATTARFGAPFMLASGLLGVSLTELPRVIRTRDWVLAVQVVVLACAVALSCALVVLTDLLSLEGQTPTEANRELLARNELTAASGLRDLWSVVNPMSNGPLHMWSMAVAMVFALGLVLAIVAAHLRCVSRPAVIGLALASVLSLTGVVVGVGQVQPNYLVLTLPYWAGLAGIGFSWPAQIIIRQTHRPFSRVAVMVLPTIFAAVLMADAGSELRNTHHSYVRAFGHVRSASVDIRSAWGDDCILITSYTPQVGYYSGCLVAPFKAPPDGLAAPGEITGTFDEMLAYQVSLLRPAASPSAKAAIVLRERGKRQPPSEEIDDSIWVGPTRLLDYGTEGGSPRRVWVQPIAPCVVSDTC